MTVKFEKSVLSGEVSAPPSKSVAHRLLILAALTGGRCKVDNLDYSEDVLAMLDCLKALGASVKTDGSSAEIDGSGFLSDPASDLYCRESGNTLRFMIPLCLTTGRRITLHGSERLMERPQSVYEDLCRENGFLYEKGSGCVSVCGRLSASEYKMSGSISSQFITGMIFALLSLGGERKIRVSEPFESRSYVELTAAAVGEFGGKISIESLGSEAVITVVGKSLSPRNVSVEGDYSNAAFLEAFNCVGGSVKVNGLSSRSVQGDRVYREYFPKLVSGCPTLDIADCPDLGPILMALGAILNGCTLTGTRRLAMKESDRGAAMSEELKKFGLDILLGGNEISVPKRALYRPSVPLGGHNDHRIVMALSVMCCVLGGEIEGAEAVRKTYPRFFDDIKSLGAKVGLI